MSSDPPNLVTFMGDYNTLSGLANRVKRLVVVDFFATWCGPCQRLLQVIPTIARDFPKVVFIKANVDDNKELAAKYGIQSIPHIKFFKGDGNDGLTELASVQGGDVGQIRANCEKYSQ